MRIVFIAFLILPLLSVSQSRLNCKPLYVWNTSIEVNVQGDNLSDRIADQIETALVEYRDCRVLNRRSYAIHEKHRNNEIIVRSINDLDPGTVNGLKTVQAQWIVISNLTMETNQTDTVYALSVSIESIETTQIIAKSEAYLSLGELLKPGQRYFIINRLLERMVGGESNNVQRDAENKAVGMHLSASIIRETAESYVHAGTMTVWNRGEKLYQDGLKAIENREFESAINLLYDALKNFQIVYNDRETDFISPFEMPQYFSFKISDFHEGSFVVKEGQTIVFSAFGVMELDPKHTEVGPAGLEKVGKNKKKVIEKGIPFGALMMKGRKDTEWQFLGDYKMSKILQTGKFNLHFQVNDKIPDDNEGVYYVEITIYPKL